MKAHRHAPTAQQSPPQAAQPASNAAYGNSAAQEDLLSTGSEEALPHAGKMAAAFDDLPLLSAVLGDTEGGAEHDANAWVEDGVPHFASDDPDAETVAHEVAHVAQEEQAPGSAASATSRPGDEAESEAADIGAQVAAGGEASPITAAPTGQVHRDFDFDWGKALDVNHTQDKAALKPEEKARIDVAEKTYTTAVHTIGAKYGLISQQQTLALGELKTAAAKQDPKGLTEEALTASIDFAFGKLFAHMGTEMALGVVTNLQEAWKSGFAATGTAASTSAKTAVSAKFGLAPGADVFFDGLAAGYIGIASKQHDTFDDRAMASWRGVDFDVLAAEKLAADAIKARDSITAQIMANTHVGITKREAFDAWMVAVARKSLGTTKAADGTQMTNMDGASMQPVSSGTDGVLYVYVTLGAAKPGNAKPWRAEAPGMSQALLAEAGVGSATGRNLRDMRLPKQFVCSVVGGDQKFQVGVNEAGVVTVSDPSVAWLSLRAGGDPKKQDLAMGVKGARLLVEEDLATQTLGGLMK